jgi:hypothetical protein
MPQWYWRQWCLWLMVAAAMAVIVVNFSVVVDAAATILSLGSTAVAKTPLLLPPLTATSINDDCYHCR